MHGTRTSVRQRTSPSPVSQTQIRCSSESSIAMTAAHPPSRTQRLRSRTWTGGAGLRGRGLPRSPVARRAPRSRRAWSVAGLCSGRRAGGGSRSEDARRQGGMYRAGKSGRESDQVGVIAGAERNRAGFSWVRTHPDVIPSHCTGRGGWIYRVLRVLDA